MRFENRSWLLFAGCALTGAAVAACSASAGDGDLAGDDSGTPDDSSSSDSSVHHDSSTHDASTALDAGQQDSTTTQDSSTPDTSSPDTSTAVDSAVDTGTVDASEAGHDSGVDAADAGLPPVGSPCSPVNSIQNEACGACGTQSRVCLGVDGGSPVWQDWGTCNNQVANGCVPGTMTTAACGLCGTQTKVCQSSCTYAVGACTGQPMNACTPGAINYQPGLSCDAGGREQTCQMDCTWSNFGNCIVFDGGSPLGLTIPLSTGSASTNKVVSLTTPGIAKLNGSMINNLCVVGTTTTVDAYVELYNPTNLTATVSVWLSAASSGTFDTLLASYAGSTSPPTDRTMCSHLSDDCDGTAPCDAYSLFSGLINNGTDNRVVLAAGATATLYVGAYSATTAMTVTVNARTDILQ